MKDVSVNDGRTVLFVSHNMAAVKSLCNKGLLLSNGEMNSYGEILDVLQDYSKINMSETSLLKSNFVKKNQEDGLFDIYEAKILNNKLQNQCIFNTKENINIYVKYKVQKDLVGSVINFSIENIANESIIFLSFDTDLEDNRLNIRNKGEYEAFIKIPSLILKPGFYFITFNTGIANFQTFNRVEKCLAFEVTLSDENETFISYAEKRIGIIAMPLLWNTNKLS